MTRVVIPVSGNFLSEKFNDCSYYQIIEIDNGATVSRKEGVPSGKYLHKLPLLVKQYGITDVITHRIDRDSLAYFNNTKINLFIGVTINTPDQLIEEYLEGTLKSNTRSIHMDNTTIK